MPQDPSELKTMPLYRDVDRIYNELRAAGLYRQEKFSVADLTSFDQYHYHGTDAVDVAIADLGINAESRVLEIGSGIGGPARRSQSPGAANGRGCAAPIPLSPSCTPFVHSGSCAPGAPG